MRRGLGSIGSLALVLVASSAGCVVPTYHLPAGFSSTYHRQLYGMEPPCYDEPDPALPTECRRGIFYATTAFRDPISIPDHQPQKRLEPLTLGSDPMTPQKVVRVPNYDAN